MTPTTVQPTTPPAASTIETSGTLYTGMLKSNTHYDGSLRLIGSQLVFTDTAGNQVINVPPQQVTKTVVTVESVIFETAGTRYTFIPDASKGTRAALAVGGAVGLGVAASKSNAAGLPEWKIALSAAGYSVKDMSMGAMAKWLIPALIAFVFLLMVMYVIVGVASE